MSGPGVLQITTLLLTVAVLALHLITGCEGLCDYPTYHDGNECVLSCPSGTIGSVNRDGANVISRDCTSHPCNNCPMNYICEPQSDGSVICICSDGYSGIDCENYIGFCHSDPCLNNGTCIDIAASNFTCSCPQRLTGRLCEVDSCDPNPCINGICTYFINSYNCVCFDGFTDKSCSTDIDDCDPNPCMNNGSCTDGVNNFTCICDTPWTGDVCDVDGINDCIDVDCNNGSCVDWVRDFQCQCDSGYTGRLCETNIDDCNGCNPEEDPVWKLNWTCTKPGVTAVVNCPYSAQGQAYRHCYDVWDLTIDVSNCSSNQLTELEENAADLKQTLIANEELNVLTYLADVQNVSKSTTSFIFTSQEQGLILPNDLSTTNNILDSVICILRNSTVKMAESQNIESILQDVSSTIDHLLNGSSNIRASYQESDKIELPNAEDLLKNTENFALAVGYLLSTNAINDTSKNITGQNFVLNAQLIPDNSTDVVFNDNDTEVSVTIPASAFDYQQSTDTEVTQMLVVNFVARNLPSYLNNSSLSTNNGSLANFLVSIQISIQLPQGSSVKLVFDGVKQQLLNLPVNNTKCDGRKSPSNLRITDATCVFWNFSLFTENIGNRGGWSSEGIMQDTDPDVPIICNTTHLTSFSVLVSTKEPPESEALSVVTYIGCGISIVSLLVNIITIVSLRKVLLKTKIYLFHLNLCIALLLSYVVFVSGIEAANQNKAACVTVAALLHYFLLATFSWMLCEGIKIFMMITFVFYKGFFQKMHFFLVIGWVIPIPFAVIPAVLLREEYYDDECDTRVCWISNAESSVWTFIGPAGFVILINSVIFVITLVKINHSKNWKNSSKKDILMNARTTIWSITALMPLLGIPWILGLFVIFDSDSLALAWIFTILNSLQGLTIFFFHVLRNNEVRKTLQDKYTRWKRVKALQTATTKEISSLEKPSGVHGNFLLKVKPPVMQSSLAYEESPTLNVDENHCNTTDQK